MSQQPPQLFSRMLLGAIAGATGTVAMTAAMNRMHAALPEEERYPLPPREITERVLIDGPDEAVMDAATVAHLAYGAAIGALIGGMRPGIGPGAGAAAGVGVWAASYFGWVPGFGVLEPADEHPPRRNALMIAAHLVWGGVTALALGSLIEARSTTLRAGPVLDAPPATRRKRSRATAELAS